MPRRVLTDHDLESLRRSLVMLESNQLALTRDQAVDVVAQLQVARAQLRELADQLDDLRRDTPQR